MQKGNVMFHNYLYVYQMVYDSFCLNMVKEEN